MISLTRGEAVELLAANGWKEVSEHPHKFRSKSSPLTIWIDWDAEYDRALLAPESACSPSILICRSSTDVPLDERFSISQDGMIEALTKIAELGAAGSRV